MNEYCWLQKNRKTWLLVNIACLIMVMCLTAAHHCTITLNAGSQVFQLSASVKVNTQINLLRHGWWIQHALNVSCIGQTCPSQWQTVRSYMDAGIVLCPGELRSCWPPLSSVSCFSLQSPTRECSALTYWHRICPLSSFLTCISSLCHPNIRLRSSHIFAVKGDPQGMEFISTEKKESKLHHHFLKIDLSNSPQ